MNIRFKHKIGFVENEVSRRYVSETPNFFTPEFRTKPDGSIKQGSGEVIKELFIPSDKSLTGMEETLNQNVLQNGYKHHMEVSIDFYEHLITIGVSPEQARFVLPQGINTEWIWTGSLLAFARFYKLRTDPHAQKEIQDLAHMVGDIIEPLYPVSWKALVGEK